MDKIVDLRNKKRPSSAIVGKDSLNIDSDETELRKPEEVEQNETEQQEIRKPQTTSLSWTTPEFTYYEKEKEWYITLLIISVGLIAAAIILSNTLFAIFIAIAGFTVALYGLKKPREIEVAVSGRGIRIDSTIYTYDHIESFWIFYDPPLLKELSLRSKKTFMPYIKIPIGETDPTEIRELLTLYIPEEAQEESLIDTVSRMLRF